MDQPVNHLRCITIGVEFFHEVIVQLGLLLLSLSVEVARAMTAQNSIPRCGEIAGVRDRSD